MTKEVQLALPETQRREALTEADIFKAADQLVQHGHKVTLETLRDALGGGSFSTISPALKAWRANQQQRQELSDIALPDALSQMHQQAIAEAWQLAQKLASDRLAAERAQLDELRENLENEAEEQRRAVEILEIELDDAQKNLASTTDQLTKSTAENHKIAAELSTAQAKISELTDREAAAVEREKEAIKQAAKLEGQLEILQKQAK